MNEQQRDYPNGKPILFSAPMVRALLAGKKTQTRRLVKCPMVQESPGGWQFERMLDSGALLAKELPTLISKVTVKPKYQVDDLLWVRETWCFKENPYNEAGEYDNTCVHFKADGYEVLAVDGDGFKEYTKSGEECSPWRSSLFMPRWASRITLKVTGVKVERVQSISREDAAAEGICYLSEIGFDGQYKDRDGYKMNVIQNHRWPEENFGHLWMMINGYDSWNRNDWVFAYEFEVQK